MAKETIGTPKFQAFYDWFNNLPSDSLGKEHWDALEVLIAALTAERDRVVTAHKVLMAEADKRLDETEAELDAAKALLITINKQGMSGGMVIAIANFLTAKEIK